MSEESDRSGTIIVVVILVIMLVMGIGIYYSYNLTNTQIQSNKKSFDSQLANQQATIDSQNSQILILENKTTVMSSQISALKNQVGNLNQSLLQTQGSLNAMILKIDNLIPQVPISTLVVLNDTYNNQTFYFQVQNTQNLSVHAQLNVLVDNGYSVQCYPNDGTAFFISPIYSLSAGETITIPFSINQVTDSCGRGPGAHEFNLNLMTANNVALSQTYTFGFP